MKCVSPKCKKHKDKCVKPNPYVEALAKCKRDYISIQQCKDDYNKDTKLAKKLSCTRYKERFDEDLPYSVIDNKKVVKTPAAISKEKLIVNDRIKSYFNFMKQIKTTGKFQVIKKNKYSYGDLQLLNKIGSESKYGAAYMVKYKDFSLAAKIMCVNYSNDLEVKLLKRVTKYVLNKKTIHFPIIYFNKLIEKNDDIPNMLLPEAIQYCHNFHLIFSEIFSGDLNMFIRNVHSLDIIQNTITQIFFSISNFSYYTNYVHLDAHGGNFLYHRVTHSNYYHYKINGKDLYLKNMGYMWVIWDYGFASKATYRRVFKDYRRVIKRFIPKVFGGWNTVSSQQPNYKMTDAELFAYNIKRDIDRMKYNFDSQLKDINLLKFEIHKVLLSYLPKSYFVKPDEVILNEGNPFIIQ